MLLEPKFFCFLRFFAIKTALAVQDISDLPTALNCDCHFETTSLATRGGSGEAPSGGRFFNLVRVKRPRWPLAAKAWPGAT